jgi:hypothetical protein
MIIMPFVWDGAIKGVGSGAVATCRIGKDAKYKSVLT